MAHSRTHQNRPWRKSCSKISLLLKAFHFGRHALLIYSNGSEAHKKYREAADVLLAMVLCERASSARFDWYRKISIKTAVR